MAGFVERALLFFDAQRYRLCAWVIMPNHVHVLFEVWSTPMERVLYSWKHYTAFHGNRFLGRTGRLWQKEYWDRYMRDEQHFQKARRYIESNPVKAGLCDRAMEWPWSSANSQWQWNVDVPGNPDQATRYHGGHLMSQNWQRFLARMKA